ncbi:MAG: hypothetical protein NT150_11045 [Bacteroidetes bacterium]|nr:hypothetical protein [Bacteroidota bacterium]
MMSILTFLFASSMQAQCTAGDGCDEINPTISAPKTINSGDVVCFTTNVNITGSVTIFSGGILRLCNGTRLNSNQSIAIFPGGTLELYGCARLGVVGSFTDFSDVAIESWCLNCNTSAYPIDTAVQVVGSKVLTGWVCNQVLPVELLSFDVFKKNDQVELSWATASEINNDYFSVMRSSDGIHWEKIGFVNGKGNSTSVSNYFFNDEMPLVGINYYKLLQVDFDGANAESPVRYVTHKGVDLFTMKSNVVENSALHLNIKGDNEILMTVTDVMGRVLYTHLVDPKMAPTLTVLLSSYSLNGVYFLSAVSGENRQTDTFVMK